MRIESFLFGLFYKDLRGIIGIDKGLIGELPISEIVIHGTALSEHLHVIFAFTYFE